MNIYHVIKEKYENDNTAEFGFGDYPRRTKYIALSVEAETRRKAMNKAKKLIPSLSFSGMFGDRLYADKDSEHLKNYKVWGTLGYFRISNI